MVSHVEVPLSWNKFKKIIIKIQVILWFFFHLLLLCQFFSATQKILKAIKFFIKWTYIYME